MIWYRATERLRAQPSGLVAAVAVRVRYRESIVVAHVAIGASRDFTGGSILVRTRQRPARGAVIEGGGGPGDGAVAGRAVCRCEGCSGRWVRGIIGRPPVRQVAARIPAVARHDIQAVVVVDVAGNASGHLAAVGHQRVRVRQRKAERRVVELAVGPPGDGVALRASRSRRREARFDVIRHIAAECGRAVPRR